MCMHVGPEKPFQSVYNFWQGTQKLLQISWQKMDTRNKQKIIFVYTSIADPQLHFSSVLLGLDQLQCCRNYTTYIIEVDTDSVDLLW